MKKFRYTHTVDGVETTEVLDYWGLRKAFPNTSFPQYNSITEKAMPEGVELFEEEIVIEPEPEPTFDELKEQKYTELEESFDDATSQGFTTSQGYFMQFSPDDSLKMEGAIQLMASTNQLVGYITQADDTTIYGIDIETMEKTKLEMLAQYAKCHQKKQLYRASIKACTTKEELDAITFDWTNFDVLNTSTSEDSETEGTSESTNSTDGE